MVDNISFLKSMQRVDSSKKRKFLKSNTDLNFKFLFNELLLHDWFQESKIIASFLSIKTEISSKFLNNFILKQDKSLCLPVVIKGSERGLQFKSCKKNEDLIIGQFNVKEPNNKNFCTPDLIFVPCLAYDLNGYRLGYGGGYYDRTILYLSSINHRFVTIGFAYDDQKVDNVISDQFDQKLNYILTEKQLYKIQ